MLRILDFIVYIFYTGYKRRTFDTKWKQIAHKYLWAYMVDRTEQTRSALAWTLSIAGGMFINYWLAEHVAIYRNLLTKYILLFFVCPGIYIVTIYQLVARRYTDERILKINAKYENRVSVAFAKFILVLVFFFLFITMSILFVYTAYAMAKGNIIE